MANPPDEKRAPGVDPFAPQEPEFLRETVSRLRERQRAFERYRVEGEVGHGGMGTVLRVWDGDLHRRLAMKVVGRAGQDKKRPVEARQLGRFIEEAQVTGQLDHPGIVPVHEIGLGEDGLVYFTMRLVAGRDLEAIFELVAKEGEGWTQTRAVGVVLKVCEAMAYAHDKGVIHRDLKPANVMVGRFGEVYVMDWGLARVLDREDDKDLRPRSNDTTTAIVLTDRKASLSGDSPLVTMDGDIIGTPAYMSPEQARGDLDAVGPSSDVFCVGAILYHLLAGHMPYVDKLGGEKPNAISVWRLVQSGPPTPVHERAPKAPAELVAICEKAMARAPGERYASMQGLAEDLRAYLEGRVVRAYETGAVAEFRKWVRRNRALAVTGISAIVLILGGTTSAALVLAGKNDELEVANEDRRKSEEKAIANAHVAEERSKQILRLSDVTRLQQLEEQADGLWPAESQNVAAYEGWLAEAHALSERRPSHERTLEELRRGALSKASPEGAAATWTFATAEEQWQHDTLAELVRGLERLADPGQGKVADVERRLAFAQTVDERSISGADARARWKAALASIADRAGSPRYAGLVVGPQLGLLPIGQDPDTGLWEFAHLQTGAIAERDPATGHLAVAPETGLVFVLVPGGTFRMGAQSEDPGGESYFEGATGDEAPPHEVTLDPFFLSKFEMTQGQWSRFTGANPSAYPPGTQFGDDLDRPVEQVSWSDCEAVLGKLGLELPTEAQWEYAARAGTATPWWTGATRETLAGAANLADKTAKSSGAAWPTLADWPEFDDGYAASSPVDRYRANPFGFHDVHGNVWEWCRDGFASYEEPARKGDGLREAGDSTFRIMRGGSFFQTAAQSSSPYRTRNSTEFKFHHVGLRPERPVRD